MKKFPKIYLTFSLFSLLLYTQCSKNEILERSYPLIETLDVSNVNEDGVTFNAIVTNAQKMDVIEYGFVWSRLNLPSLTNSDKKIFTTNFSSGHFSAEIKTTLLEGLDYYVRAFVKTNDYLVYGNSFKFNSSGSTSAFIEKLEPNTGVWGDTIKMIGKDFSYITANNKITLDDKDATVVKSNDSIITFIVPEGLKKKEIDVKITIAKNESVAKNKFIIKTPKITSISSLTATFGDEITITGEDFGAQKNYNKVFFGNVESTVVSADANTIKVLVPNDLEFSTIPIKVESHKVAIVHNLNFKLKSPILSSIKQGVKTNSEVLIKGKYFHPIKEKNIITFEGNQAEVIAVFNDSIKVKTPNGPYPRRKAKVKIQLLDDVVEYSNDIDILNKWIQVSDNLPFNFFGFPNYYVSTNNEVFIVGRLKDNYIDFTYYLWKLNPVNFSWERLNIPENISISNIISNGDKLYIYDSNSNFWEFDPSTTNWTQKQSYPGERRKWASNFSINGEIYIGLGTNSDYNFIDKHHSDFYKYNPSSDTWTKISDFPYQTYSMRTNTSTFVINGIAYLGNGATNTGMTDFWSYNPVTDTWTRIADFIDARSDTSAFALNGKGYVVGGDPITNSNTFDCWQYDPLIGSWEKIENVGLTTRSKHFSFVINGKAYVGGGVNESGSFQLFDMYEFKTN